MNSLWILLSLTVVLSSPVDPWFPSPDCPANQPYWCPNLQGCYSLEERPDDCYRPAASAPSSKELDSPPVCAESVFHVWCANLKSCVLLEDYQDKCIEKVLGAQGKNQEKPNTPIPSSCEGSVNCPLPPGADKDEHGCIRSAGYQWCPSLQQCLRSWETLCPDSDFDE